MASPQELADAYAAGAAQVRAAVAGMTREQLLARPVPGKWSVLEVVCHIADFEPVFADRMKRIIASGADTPLLLAADENLFAAELKYQERDLEEELAVIEATRRQIARVVRLLAPEHLQRVGNHSARGPQTLGRIIQAATDHIPHHLPFIAEKREALGA